MLNFLTKTFHNQNGYCIGMAEVIELLGSDGNNVQNASFLKSEPLQ